MGTLMNFTEAVEYAASRSVKLPEDYYGKLVGVQRAQAVSIAGLASLEQIKLVIDAVNNAMTSGSSFEDFKKKVRESGVPLPAHRLDNIFRTNMQTAYNRGRAQQQRAVASTRPYLMYDAVNDSRTRENHLAFDGTILHRDDPWWKTHYPPNGYRCRCTVISLTEKQAQKRGVTASPPSQDPDEGWDYSPEDYPKGVDQALDQSVEDKAVRDVSVAGKLSELRRNIKSNNSSVKAMFDGLEYFSEEELKDVVAWLNKDPNRAKAAAKMSGPEVASLYAYTTGDYLQINNLSRQESWSGSERALLKNVLSGYKKALDQPEFRAATEVWDSTAKKYKPKTLYRGLEFFGDDPELWDKFDKAHKPGSSVTYTGFTSTTPDKGVADSFMGRMGGDKKVRLEIDGSGRKALDAKHFSYDLGEVDDGEALIPPGATMKVLSRQYEGDVLVIRLKWMASGEGTEFYHPGGNPWGWSQAARVLWSKS